MKFTKIEFFKLKSVLILVIISLNAFQAANLKSGFFKADTLNNNERLESNNGNYFAIMQGDGNLVVYSKKGFNGRDREIE